MTAGTTLHTQHGKKVILAGLLRSLAYLLVLAALGLLAAELTQAFLGSL